MAGSSKVYLNRKTITYRLLNIRTGPLLGNIEWFFCQSLWIQPVPFPDLAQHDFPIAGPHQRLLAGFPNTTGVCIYSKREGNVLKGYFSPETISIAPLLSYMFLSALEVPLDKTQGHPSVPRDHSCSPIHGRLLRVVSPPRYQQVHLMLHCSVNISSVPTPASWADGFLGTLPKCPSALSVISSSWLYTWLRMLTWV